MALFTAIGTAVGSLFTGGSFATFAIKTLAKLAVSAIVRKLTQKKTSSQVYGTSGKLQGGDDVPRQFPLGIGAAEGSLVYGSFWGADGAPNSHFTQVIALSDLPVKGLLEVWVDGVKRTIGATAVSGEEDLGLPITEYLSGGRNHAWVKFYDGTQTVADPLLLGRGAHPDYPWSAQAVGRGIAYAVVTTKVNNELFSGFPSFRFVLDSVRLYDPSKDTSVGGSGSQRWSNPATWGGDGDYLPVVQAYNIMRGIRYNGAWLYGFQRLILGQLPVSWWIAEIEKCRATVTNSAGAQEPRFRSGGVISVAAECGEAIEAVIAATAGRILEIGGIYKPQVGIRGATAMSFTDDDLVSTEGHGHTPFKRLAETINAVVASYPDPTNGFVLKEAPRIFDAALEAIDGGRRLPSAITLSNVPYPDQVQRICAMALDEARRMRRHLVVFPPRFYRLETGDEVTWTSARHGYVNKPFRIAYADLRSDCHVIADLIEIDDSGVNYDAWTGYRPISTTSPIAPNPSPATLFGFTAVAGSVKDSSSASRRPAIDCAWQIPGNGVFRGVEVRVALASNPSQVVSFTFDQVKASAQIAEGVLPATDYLVCGAPITNTPRQFGPWITVSTGDLRFTQSDLASTVNAEIAKGQSALDAAAAVQSDHDTLVAGFTGDLATAFAEQAARAQAGLNGWVKDPIFTEWSGNTLLADNWANRTGILAYGAESGGAYGGGLSINVPSGSDGVEVIASTAANSGLIGADATAEYAVVELEVDYIAGNPDGAALRVEWSSNGTTWTRGEFAGASANLGLFSTWGLAPKPGTRQSVRGLWKRPTGVSGHMRLRYIPKISTVTDAQQMVGHRLNIRAATQADIDAGQTYTIASGTPGATVAYAGIGAAIAGMNTAFSARVGGASGLEASVSNILGARSDLMTGTALAALLTQLQVSTSTGLSAWATSQATAVSTLQGNASASYAFRVGAGGATAGLELVAFDNAASGAASNLKLRADQIGLYGNVFVAAGNLFPDFDMVNAGFYASSTSAGYTLIANASAKLGTNFLNLLASSDEERVESGWFNVQPSTEYLVQGAAWAASAGGATASLLIETGSVDAGGAITVLGSTTVRAANTATYGAVSSHGTVSLTTGATARRARFVAVRAAGGANAARFGGFAFEKRVGGTLVVDGGIEARHMNVVELSAITANVGILRTATSGARLEIRGDRILVYDASNVLRVRIGNLT